MNSKQFISLSDIKKDPETRDALAQLVHVETIQLQRRVADLELYTGHLRTELDRVKLQLENQNDHPRERTGPDRTCYLDAYGGRKEA